MEHENFKTFLEDSLLYVNTNLCIELKNLAAHFSVYIKFKGGGARLTQEGEANAHCTPLNEPLLITCAMLFA